MLRRAAVAVSRCVLSGPTSSGARTLASGPPGVQPDTVVCVFGHFGKPGRLEFRGCGIWEVAAGSDQTSIWFIEYQNYCHGDK